MLKTSLPRIKISVASTSEIVTRPHKEKHILTRIFQESQCFRLKQRYHEQDNDCVHNVQIYNTGVKIAARESVTPFPNGTVNKKFALSRFCFNKNDERARILLFVQYRFSIGSEPKVVIFMARRAVCFVCPATKC